MREAKSEDYEKPCIPMAMSLFEDMEKLVELANIMRISGDTKLLSNDPYFNEG